MSKPKPRGKPFDERRARLAAYEAAARQSPEKRSENARKAGLASAAKRAAERAALGLPTARERWAAKPQPSAEQLADYVERVIKENPTAEWSYDQIRRQAIALMRAEVARFELAALDRKIDE